MTSQSTPSPILTILSWLKSLSTKSAGLRQSVINMASSATASALAAVATILISRVLGPSGFGQFSTAFALALILVKLNDLGFSTATAKLVPTQPDLTEKQQLLQAITNYRLWLSTIIVALGLMLTPLFSRVLDTSPILIALAVILSLATTYFEHTLLSLQALHNFTRAAVINILQAGFKLILTVFFVVVVASHDLGSVTQAGLIFSLYMISPFLPVLLLAAINPKQIPLFHKVKSQTLEKKFHLRLFSQQLWPIVKHAGVGLLAAGIIENIDILFVKANLSAYEAGLLGGVSRIALLLYVLAYALGNVLNPRVAKYEHQPQHLQKFWHKAWLVLGACILGFVFSMFLAKPLITLTIGSEYLPALAIMRILLGAGFISIAVMPFIALFYAFDASWYFSVSGIVQLAIVLTGNIWLVPIYGLEAAAWTRLVARGVLLVLTIGLGWLRFKNFKNVADIKQKQRVLPS